MYNYLIRGDVFSLTGGGVAKLLEHKICVQYVTM